MHESGHIGHLAHQIDMGQWCNPAHELWCGLELYNNHVIFSSITTDGDKSVTMSKYTVIAERSLWGYSTTCKEETTEFYWPNS